MDKGTISRVGELKVEIIFSPKLSDPLKSSGDGKLLKLSSKFLYSVLESVNE